MLRTLCLVVRVHSFALENHMKYFDKIKLAEKLSNKKCPLELKPITKDIIKTLLKLSDEIAGRKKNSPVV